MKVDKYSVRIPANIIRKYLMSSRTFHVIRSFIDNFKITKTELQYCITVNCKVVKNDAKIQPVGTIPAHNTQRNIYPVFEVKQFYRI